MRISRSGLRAAVASLALLAAMPITLLAQTATSSAYDAFNAFCKESFGATKEPLTYEHFGTELKVLDGSEWMHASEASACIAWTTNLPASTLVEYGTTPQLGSRTTAHERAFYTHIHYLRDLKPNTTYHYRYASTDERGTATVGDIHTFKTAAAGKARQIGALDGGQPYRISSPGEYVVTADLIAAGTAFVIEANDVTLDLGGHTVVYNAEKMAGIEGEDPNVWFEKAPKGVQLVKRNLKNVRVVNGTVRQGAGNDGAQPNGRGANPIASQSGCTGEIAGVTVEWSGAQVMGFMMMWAPPIDLHHNVITDLGTELTNRHQGVAAIASVPKPHHNLIKRTRHRGIDSVSGGEVYRNEVYVDSYATNSSGIMAYKVQNLTVRDNRVLGGGYLAIGISPVSQGTKDVKVFDNFVHLQAGAPSATSAEYGDQSGAYCFRVTWGGENIECFDNTFIAKGRDGGMVRGVWYCPDAAQKNNVIRDNVIKAVVEGDASDVRGAVVISGEGKETDPPVLIANNRIISNFCHVLLGEPYGAGSNARLVGNTFEREGSLPRYRFVQIGHGNQRCAGTMIVDPVFSGDLQPDMVRWEGHDGSTRDFGVAYTLALQGPANAQVEIKDASGGSTTHTIGGDGTLKVELVAERFANGQHTVLTPHKVMIAGQTREVVMNRPTELRW